MVDITDDIMKKTSTDNNAHLHFTLITYILTNHLLYIFILGITYSGIPKYLPENLNYNTIIMKK